MSLRLHSIAGALGLAASLWCAAAAAADDIHLRNGSIIRGTIVRETQSGIIVRIARNQQIHVKYAEIAEVRRDGQTVPLDRATDRQAVTRDPHKEQALIRFYTRQLEIVYFRQNPGVVRIPYHIKKEECDPVRAAQRYGLPVEDAKSNKELENMFELTLTCYKNGATPAWRRTLLLYGKPRSEYIAAIGRDIELANIYLDHPNLPLLLALTDE